MQYLSNKDNNVLYVHHTMNVPVFLLIKYLLIKMSYCWAGRKLSLWSFLLRKQWIRKLHSLGCRMPLINYLI